MSQVFCNGSGATVASAVSYNNLVFVGGTSGIAAGNWSASASARTLIAPTAGVFKNLRVVLSAAPGAGDTRTFSVEKNTVVSALTCVFGAADVDITNATHQVAVAAGDRLTLRHDPTGTPTLATVQWSVEFVPDVLSHTIYGGSLGAQFVNTEQRFHSLLAPTAISLTTEVNHAHLISSGGTLTAYYVELSAAVTSGSWLVQIYKNGAPETSSNLTISTGTSGVVTGLNIHVAPGDLLSLSGTPTGSPPLTSVAVGALIIADVLGESMIVGVTSGEPGTSATRFNSVGLFSSTQAWQATEATIQALCGPTAFLLRDFRATVQNAPTAGKQWTVAVNKTGSAVLSAVIADANTSAGPDTTVVSVANGQLLSIAITPAGTPSAAGRSKWAVTQFVPPLAGPLPTFRPDLA